MQLWVTSYSSQILFSVALEHHLEIAGFPLFITDFMAPMFRDFHTWNKNNKRLQRHNGKIQLQLKINLVGDKNRPGWRSQHSLQVLSLNRSMEFSIITNRVKSDTSELCRRKFVLFFISYGRKGLWMILKGWFFSLHSCLTIRDLNVFLLSLFS